jgi:hypothetical protein
MRSHHVRQAQPPHTRCKAPADLGSSSSHQILGERPLQGTSTAAKNNFNVLLLATIPTAKQSPIHPRLVSQMTTNDLQLVKQWPVLPPVLLATHTYLPLSCSSLFGFLNIWVFFILTQMLQLTLAPTQMQNVISHSKSHLASVPGPAVASTRCLKASDPETP